MSRSCNNCVATTEARVCEGTGLLTEGLELSPRNLAETCTTPASHIEYN